MLLRNLLLALAMTPALLFLFQNCGKMSSKDLYKTQGSHQHQDLEDLESNEESNGVGLTFEEEQEALIDELEETDPIAPSLNIASDKSIMITDHNVLNTVNSRYEFAELLGRVSVFFENRRSKEKQIQPGEFVARIFETAYTDQKDHIAAPNKNKLGPDPMSDRLFNKVFKEWKSKNQLSSIKKPADLKGSPFRLLAIANLMDRAGDRDDRGLMDATKTPRSLGEMHFIYGYIDKEREKNQGSPYPQTWVISYRIPTLNVGQNLSLADLISQNNDWEEQMSLWASAWAELSKYALNDPIYLEKLKKIVDAIATPDNFMHVRSNTLIRSGEFELREWYVLQNQAFVLIPRKPRREIYKCFQESGLLKNWIEKYWVDGRNDLDEATIQLDKPMRRGHNGYTIPKQMIVFNGGDKSKEYVASCGLNKKDVPFGMYGLTGTNFGEDSNFVVPPFARANKDFIWRVKNLDESKRHAFAIRTCSGCHSSEGAANGFHIEPRMANQNSKLSPFLTGRGANTFSFNGKVYEYRELDKRKEWLKKAVFKEAQIFDSLFRMDEQ